jgi:molecular chaperone GrpE
MSKKNKDASVQENPEQMEKTAETGAKNEQQITDNQSAGENPPSSSEEELARLKAEKEELKDKYLRLLAEFENFKKRNTRERIDLLNTAAQDTLTALLPALDDFDRAISLPDEQKNTPAFQEGIHLVHQKLNNILRQRGLEVMDSNGAEFDPEYHEALTEIPAPNEELKGKIIDTVEKGYTLKGKIIRYAKVVVGK